MAVHSGAATARSITLGSGYPVRREVYLIDQEGDANDDLGAVLDDVVATIEAFLDEGRTVALLR